MRGPLAWPPIPLMRTPRERFEDLVLVGLDLAVRRLAVPEDTIEIAVEDVPPHDPAPWEDGVPVARTFPGAGRGDPDRVVLYRRPLELLAARQSGVEGDDADLADLVVQVVTEQVARLRGIDPGDVPGLRDPDDPR